MAEETKQPRPVITQASQQETIKVPKEYASFKNAVQVTIEGDSVTLQMNSAFAEEIGAYRRCDMKIKFVNGQVPSIIPIPRG